MSVAKTRKLVIILLVVAGVADTFIYLATCYLAWAFMTWLGVELVLKDAILLAVISGGMIGAAWLLGKIIQIGQKAHSQINLYALTKRVSRN